MSEETKPVQDNTDPGEKLYGSTTAEGDKSDGQTDAQGNENKLEAKSDGVTDSEQADDDKVSKDTNSSDEQKQSAKSDDDYSLELPDETELTDAHLKEIEAFAKDKGLSREVAEQVLDLQNKLLKERKESAADALKEVSETWKATASKDSEYGGENFGKNIELAKRAVERFSTPEFMEDLDRTGFGNHPELLRTFYRIGKAMADGDFVKSGAQAAKPKSMEQLFYGNSTT